MLIIKITISSSIISQQRSSWLHQPPQHGALEVLVAETEKYAVELSIEPHMPAGPFLVGGNTGFHPFGLLYIILNIFLCVFSLSAFLKLEV